MKNIVIIPVRGGSKRLPEKNIMEFGGLPLLVHSINYAKENKPLVDEIYVSTDCSEIKTIALDNNVKVIDRPKAISGDLEPTITALQHVIENIDEEVANVILLQATNPLRPKSLLDEALKIVSEGRFDSLMTVTRNHQKFGKIQNEQFVSFNYEIGQRSQDLEPLYFENGLLYITKASLIKKGSIVGNNNCPYIVNHPYAKVDIDDLEDVKYAEFILKNYPNE